MPQLIGADSRWSTGFSASASCYRAAFRSSAGNRGPTTDSNRSIDSRLKPSQHRLQTAAILSGLPPGKSKTKSQQRKAKRGSPSCLNSPISSADTAVPNVRAGSVVQYPRTRMTSSSSQMTASQPYNNYQPLLYSAQLSDLPESSSSTKVCCQETYVLDPKSLDIAIRLDKNHQLSVRADKADDALGLFGWLRVYGDQHNEPQSADNPSVCVSSAVTHAEPRQFSASEEADCNAPARQNAVPQSLQISNEVNSLSKSHAKQRCANQRSCCVNSLKSANMSHQPPSNHTVSDAINSVSVYRTVSAAAAAANYPQISHSAVCARNPQQQCTEQQSHQSSACKIASHSVECVGNCFAATDNLPLRSSCLAIASPILNSWSNSRLHQTNSTNGEAIGCQALPQSCGLPPPAVEISGSQHSIFTLPSQQCLGQRHTDVVLSRTAMRAGKQSSSRSECGPSVPLHSKFHSHNIAADSDTFISRASDTSKHEEKVVVDVNVSAVPMKEKEKCLLSPSSTCSHTLNGNSRHKNVGNLSCTAAAVYQESLDAQYPLDPITSEACGGEDQPQHEYFLRINSPISRPCLSTCCPRNDLSAVKEANRDEHTLLDNMSHVNVGTIPQLMTDSNSSARSPVISHKRGNRNSYADMDSQTTQRVGGIFVDRFHSGLADSQKIRSNKLSSISSRFHGRPLADSEESDLFNGQVTTSSSTSDPQPGASYVTHRQPKYDSLDQQPQKAHVSSIDYATTLKMLRQMLLDQSRKHPIDLTAGPAVIHHVHHITCPSTASIGNIVCPYAHPFTNQPPDVQAPPPPPPGQTGPSVFRMQQQHVSQRTPQIPFQPISQMPIAAEVAIPVNYISPMMPFPSVIAAGDLERRELVGDPRMMWDDVTSAQQHQQLRYVEHAGGWQQGRQGFEFIRGPDRLSSDAGKNVGAALIMKYPSNESDKTFDFTLSPSARGVSSNVEKFPPHNMAARRDTAMFGFCTGYPHDVLSNETIWREHSKDFIDCSPNSSPESDHGSALTEEWRDHTAAGDKHFNLPVLPGILSRITKISSSKGEFVHTRDSPSEIRSTSVLTNRLEPSETNSARSQAKDSWLPYAAVYERS